MSKLRVPYQCIEKAGNFLVAARGSSIDLFSFQDLSLLSTWNPITQDPSTKGTTQSAAKNPATNTSRPPTLRDTDASQRSPTAKRRKLSDGGAAQTAEEREEKIKKTSNSRFDSVASGLEAPAIVALTVTRGGQHVIAVTGEDKTIRVFKITIKEDRKPCLASLSGR